MRSTFARSAAIGSREPEQLLAIPHYVVLFFLYVGAIVVVIVAWFAILFTGRCPRGIFDHVEGVIRWHTAWSATHSSSSPTSSRPSA